MGYAVRKKIIHSDFTARAAVGTTYDLAKPHSFDLTGKQGAVGAADVPFKFVEMVSLWVTMTSISGATELSIIVCSDAAGDQAIMAPITATIMAGQTTATKGTCSIHLLDYAAAIPTDSDGLVYIFFRTDAGSVQVDASILTTVA